jgi:hypothetical protein
MILGFTQPFDDAPRIAGNLQTPQSDAGVGAVRGVMPVLAGPFDEEGLLRVLGQVGYPDLVPGQFESRRIG